MNSITATPKTILVTGASSGIGEATARELARRGHRVVVGARRGERLDALCRELAGAGAQVAWRELDVTRPEDMQAFVAFAEERFGPVEVLVNNAGIMPLSPLRALKIDEWDRMLDVNVRGVLHGIAAVLPGMQARGRGQIVNVSSIGGHAVWPNAAVYCATKYAVRAISDGLRQETDTIRVTIVSPGVVESELADTITDAGAREAMKAFREVALPAQAIADAVAYAVEQPAHVDVSELIVRPTASPY